MPNKTAKKPVVTRFTRKPTYAGRDVKRTTVVRRDRPMTKERKMVAMRPMRKGRG